MTSYTHIALSVIVVFAILISGYMGYRIGRGALKNSLTDLLIKGMSNIENYIIIIAVAGFGFATSNGLDDNAFKIGLNIFSTLIFTWLMSKKSSNNDFKHKEEQLAKMSYRHIDYIEIAAARTGVGLSTHRSYSNCANNKHSNCKYNHFYYI